MFLVTNENMKLCLYMLFFFFLRVGLDENVSKMDVDRRRQRRPVCGRHRPVEKLSLVDVDQLRPVEKRQDGRRRPVEKFSYLLLGGRSKGRTLQLQLTLKLSIKGKKRKE